MTRIEFECRWAWMDALMEFAIRETYATGHWFYRGLHTEQFNYNMRHYRASMKIAERAVGPPTVSPRIGC